MNDVPWCPWSRRREISRECRPPWRPATSSWHSDCPRRSRPSPRWWWWRTGSSGKRWRPTPGRTWPASAIFAGKLWAAAAGRLWGTHPAQPGCPPQCLRRARPGNSSSLLCNLLPSWPIRHNEHCQLNTTDCSTTRPSLRRTTSKHGHGNLRWYLINSEVIKSFMFKHRLICRHRMRPGEANRQLASFYRRWFQSVQDVRCRST